MELCNLWLGVPVGYHFGRLPYPEGYHVNAPAVGCAHGPQPMDRARAVQSWTLSNNGGPIQQARLLHSLSNRWVSLTSQPFMAFQTFASPCDWILKKMITLAYIFCNMIKIYLWVLHFCVIVRRTRVSEYNLGNIICILCKDARENAHVDDQVCSDIRIFEFKNGRTRILTCHDIINRTKS
jgi:hypothetical protein